MIIGNKMTIQEIRDKLKKASDVYYNTGESIMLDQEFDNLRDELTRLSPDDPFLSTVGAPLRPSEWIKAKHKIPMSSLHKKNIEPEFLKWLTEINDTFYSIEDKLDGLSIDLEYLEGVLIHAITRGDEGIEGEDILVNVSKMKNVKTKIPGFTGSIRGEIIILLDDFEKVREIYLKEGKELKNPRNSVSGIAKRYDGKCSEYLTIYFYDVVKESYEFETEVEKKEFIKDTLGLEVCFYKKVNAEQSIKVYNAYEEKLRAETNYDIDGLVIKANTLKLQNELGLVGNRPKGQIAWKFTSIKKVAKVLDVKWSIRNKRVTPIIYIEPTQVGGVIVRKMTSHNIDFFKKLKLYKGCNLLFQRSNDVIPIPLKVIE